MYPRKIWEHMCKWWKSEANLAISIMTACSYLYIKKIGNRGVPTPPSPKSALDLKKSPGSIIYGTFIYIYIYIIYIIRFYNATSPKHDLRINVTLWTIKGMASFPFLGLALVHCYFGRVIVATKYNFKSQFVWAYRYNFFLSFLCLKKRII